MRRSSWIALAALTGALVMGAALAHGASPKAGFRPAGQGCPMAHCDPSMSDQVLMPAPRRLTGSWFDHSAASGDQGLGCAGNGHVALCTFGNEDGDTERPYMKAYGPRGGVLWTSRRALDSWSWTSVPIVNRRGGAIMADDSDLVRFSHHGKVLWRTPTPGGRPISPTQTASGAIVLATRLGGLSAYDPKSGRRIGKLKLSDQLDGLDGFFDTTNTPGRRGNRIYVSTQFTLDSGQSDPNHHARLYAIDVDPSKPRGRRLRVAWHFDFGARSGASPTVKGRTIVFDGDRATPEDPPSPRFFGIRDMGEHPKLLWQHPLRGFGVASAATDPRGGAWTFAFAKPTLSRISMKNGAVIQDFDLSTVIGEPAAPFSAMSIARGPHRHPVMIVSARSVTAAWLVAIDLVRERMLWKRQLPGDVKEDTPEGQFPVLRHRDGKVAVVFTTRSGVRGVVGPAVRGVGHPPAPRRLPQRLTRAGSSRSEAEAASSR
jgi:hypothetical protein